MRLVELEEKGLFIDITWIVRSVYMEPTYDPDTNTRLFYASDQAKDRCSGDQFLRLGAINDLLY